MLDCLQQQGCPAIVTTGIAVPPRHPARRAPPPVAAAASAVALPPRFPMPLVLVAPGLLSLPAAALDREAAFARLASHSGEPQVEPMGIAAALLRSSRWPVDTPVAPLAALGAGIDPGAGFALIAEPVHFDAGRADIVLTRCVDDLDGAEAQALVATLSDHFAVDALRFVAPRPGAWFALAETSPDIATTPVDAVVGRSPITHLPQGRDAGTWKRWQDEIGMLLYGHPVNAAREACGCSSVNAVWFWGGGRIAPDRGRAPVSVAAASGRTADIARGMALASHGTTTPWPPGPHWIGETLRLHAPAGDARASNATVIVVCEAIGGVAAAAGETSAAGFARARLAPALAMLEGRRIDALHLVADGNGVAATWTAQAPGRLARQLARWRKGAFRLPAASAR